jgi:hypothetical protein
MKLLCTTIFTLAITTASFADIYQYEDCDGNGTLLLTELDAELYVDLSGLYLGCASLRGAILAYAHLNDADLTYADLIDANLYNADLANADLTYADLIDANLTNAGLTYADLVGADLSNANLFYADLILANLSSANLNGADLSNSNLTGAALFGADLFGAIEWQTATWAGAAYNDATIFPNGMNPEKFGMIYDSIIVNGACCVTSGCDVVEETMCVNFGGTWTEAGSCDDCVAPPETCDADLDGDGEVKVADLLLLIGAWGVCP